MQPEVARTILIAIAAVGGVTWLIALRFLTSSFRVKGSPGPEPMDRLDPTTPRMGEVLEGRALVEGRPSELSAKATTILAKERTGPLGSVKIMERSGDRVVFEGSRNLAWSQAVCRVGRGELRFASSRDAQTEIRYQVELAGGRWLLPLGILFQALGAVALVVGFWALNTFAVTHPDAGVRGQVFQMLQAVHFLWPPFLCGGLYRFGRSSVRAQLDTLIHNLPYFEQ